MAFTRTTSGLSNLALFHGVDLVVYTEGGSCAYTFDEIMSGGGSKSSVDIKFWAGVFEKNDFDKKIEFKALGSKSSADKICRKIVGDGLSNVVVTRDSDLDDFLGGKFESPFILYTRGYSWENDVYDKDLIEKQIESLVMRQALTEEYLNIIVESYDNFYLDASRLLRLELIFRKNGIRLITELKGERFINGKSKPRIKFDQVRVVVSKKKDSIGRPVNLSEFNLNCCPIRYCYGKLQEALAMSVINYIVGVRERGKSLPKDFLVASMIERYRITRGLLSDEYYKNLIDQLKAA